MLKDDDSQDNARPLLSEGLILNEDSASQRPKDTSTPTPVPQTKPNEPKTRKNIGHYSIGKLLSLIEIREINW
jgi:hypothetical protein